MKAVKWISLGVIAILIADLILFAMRKITLFVFWMILAGGAFYLYFILPRLVKS